MEKIFKIITDQTGFLFVYRDEWLKQTRPVTLNVRGISLKQALEICFADQPFTYEIMDKMVVLKERTVAAAPAGVVMDAAKGNLIRGRVSDSTGSPLVGASIAIRGSSRGASTDIHGEFALMNVPEGSWLIISFTGYTTRQILLSDRSPAYHNILMRPSLSELDATVIQAYGSTSRRFNVGSISTVDAKTIQRQPVTNVLLALQGQAPGLAVNAANGVPGSSVQIQLRGQNTILGTSMFKPYDQPLFIIDGVPFAPQNNVISQLGSLAMGQSFNGGISQFTGMSPFNGINPADIESITILRDADATSIYGTQGSNGVILITTKKGKAGRTILNLTANTGFNTAARRVKLMNTQQYLQLRKDAFAADGLTPSANPADPGYAPDLMLFDQNRQTDWQKTIFGKTSNSTDLHASISGGNFSNTYLISGGYTRSNYNFPGNYADQRLTLHSASHHVSTNDRFTVDLTLDYSYDQNNSAGFGAAQNVLLPPNMPALLDSAGDLVWKYKGVSFSGMQFYSYLKKPYRLQAYNLNGSLRLNWKIFTGFSFTTNLGYSRHNSNEHDENPAISMSPDYINRSADFATNNFQTINVEPQFDYGTRIGKGDLTVLAGATWKKTANNSTSLTGYGYANDNLLGSINGAMTLSSYDNTSLYKYAALFGRIRYIYDGKYILSLGGRRDGSSNFGPGRQFGNFGSVGAGWIFSEEKGFRKLLPFFSFGKFSGSYGTSGSDGIAAYNYQQFWQPVGYMTPFQGSIPNQPQNLYNPNYSWALKKSLNLALDLGFFRDRILLNTTYYRNREGNQLGGYPLPIQAGFSSVLQNLPAVIQNQGWEFTLTSHNIRSTKLEWTTSFNISFNRNKLVSFPNLAGSSYNTQYVIGKPVSIVLGYRYKGVNPTTGLFEVYDQHGQATTNPTYGLPANGGDMVPIANREVKYMGGLGNTLTWKGFSLYVYFQFSSQTAPSYLNTAYGNNTPAINMGNFPAIMIGQFWTKPGDVKPLQRLTTSYSSGASNAISGFISSSAMYVDDTYLRLKTVSLSWNLPATVLKRIGVHDGSVFANVQNLATFTNYKVADPETFSDYTSFPLQRTVAFGLNFNF